MSGEYLYQVGNILGLGEINLGVFGIPFTIFCVVGLMNAFNMIDGLNGICASLALIPIMYVTFLGKFSYGLLVPIGAILGFLAYNLGFLGKKRRVFLGDSGSNMLGFAVAFICIEYSQNINHTSDHVIENCINSIDSEIEIVVVDNSNNDKFKDKIETKYKNVKCILSKENLAEF